MPRPRETTHRPASPDLTELLSEVPDLGVPRPAYDGRSLANVGPTILRASGVEGSSGSIPLAPPLASTYDPFRGRRADGPIVVFLVDGLGWNLFREWVEDGSAEASRWSTHARAMTTVFPTTTTAALTSLSSGTPPGRHGLVGYRQFLPRYGVVADMLKMSPLGTPTPDLLVGPTWAPSDISGAPTIFRRGVDGIAVSRDRFQGSGFTRVLYDGAAFAGYSTLADFAHELVRLIARPDPPGVIFAYWDELDTIQHLRGRHRGLASFELDRIAGMVAYVRDHVPSARRARTTLLVTGDHGQVPATPAARIPVETHPAIVRELAHPLAGDRRAGFFAARPGRLPALRSALQKVVPPSSTILDMERALDGGLFGPPPYHAEIAARLGDLLVLVPAPTSLTYLLPGAAPPARYMLGAHGGLDPDELIVPLVAGRLEDFGKGAGQRSPAVPQR
ncbi:MAG: alkaline phosphatase family protein [Thermoplasmata archaeon]